MTAAPVTTSEAAPPEGEAIPSHERSHLNRSSVALLLNTAVTGIVGFGYWILATHLLPKAVVGVAAALISASTLFSGLGQLNLSSMLMRFLPQAHERSARLIALAYVAAAGVSFTLAIAVIGVTSLSGSRGSPLHLQAWEALAFAACVAANAVFVLEDAALLGIGRSMWIPVENVTFGLLKVLTLFAAAWIGTAYALFISWFLPLLVIIPLLNGIMFTRVLDWPRVSIRGMRPASPEARRTIRRYVRGDAGAGIFQQTLIYALPWLVTARLGSRPDALFYSALILTTSIDMVASNLTSALTVEGSRTPDQLAQLVRKTLRRSGVLTGVCVAVVVIAAPVVLAAYGRGYSAASDTLRLLALACIPRALCLIYFGVCRVQQQTYISARLQGLTCAVTFGSALLFAGARGISGVADAVVLGQLVCVVFALPTLSRLVRA
jgi:O-antigen/teichoic acid export membrane protein